jgi:uncharacterized YigZ family protein
MNVPPYVSVRSEAEAEITIKRSVFHASIAPCTTKDAAMAFLERMRTQRWDAVHHCFAWRIGPYGLEYRMSDDGEPSGTAGKPILFAMQRASISDAIIVVTRYFGGIKLGVGPLARAYADAAQAAIAVADTWTVRHMAHVTVFCTYDDVSVVTRTLEEADARFTPSYADAVTFDVDVAAEQLDALLSAITDRTNARAGYSKVSAQ